MQGATDSNAREPPSRSDLPRASATWPTVGGEATLPAGVRASLRPLVAWALGTTALDVVLVAFPLAGTVWGTGAVFATAIALAFELALTLATAEILRPVLAARAAKLKGEALASGQADTLERALRRAPWAAAALRLGAYGLLAAALVARATLAPGDGATLTQRAARGALHAFVHGAGVAGLAALWLERALERMRPWLLPNLDAVRAYAAVYRRRLALVGTMLLGLGLLAAWALAVALEHVGTATATTALVVASLALIPGVVSWALSVRRRTAPIEAYFEAVVRRPGTRGPSRDEPRAPPAFRAAQALPYRSGLYLALALGLAFVAGVAGARAALGFDVDVAVRLLVALTLVAWLSAVFAVGLLREAVRPLLRLLASRHVLPADDVRSPLGLAAKLVALGAGLAVGGALLAVLVGWAAPRGLVAAAAVASGGGVVFAIVIVFFARQTVAPLTALESRSGELARGELARPVPPAGEADEIGRLTAVFDDMRRSMRDRLRSTESINVDLEREVRRRTEALEQRNAELRDALERLRKAQDELIRSEKLASMGRLVAGIAHEVNNPLNAVINSLGPLDDTVRAMAAARAPAELAELAAQGAQMMAVIQRGAGRARAIVQALHNYSRGDETTYRDVDLGRCIDDCLDLLRHRLKGIAVDKSVDPQARVRGLPGQIDQVLMNLITNAAQALGGKGSIRVEARLDPSDDRFVTLAVADDGPGIPADVLPRIFDPFFTTKDVGEGSGLGLSIVHGIVERHGGTITVDSAVGRGTTFAVRLPRERGGPS